MSNEMVCRVARAVQGAVRLTDDEAYEAARAAIAAMREPTEAMLRRPGVSSDQIITAIWTVMIDAALNEPGSDRTR